MREWWAILFLKHRANELNTNAKTDIICIYQPRIAKCIFWNADFGEFYSKCIAWLYRPETISVYCWNIVLSLLKKFPIYCSTYWSFLNSFWCACQLCKSMIYWGPLAAHYKRIISVLIYYFSCLYDCMLLFQSCECCMKAASFFLWEPCSCLCSNLRGFFMHWVFQCTIY